MADRYGAMGQVFFADGTANCNVDGRVVADTDFTVAAAGNFTITMANGTTGTVTGTNINGSPVALAAGVNTIVCSDAVADGHLDITIGTAANWNTVNSWSAADGGAVGASVPTSADNVYFTANAFTAASQVLTVDAAASCLSMDWTGAGNTPTLAHSATLNVYGAYTGIAGMSHTGTSKMAFPNSTGGSVNITWGVALSCPLEFPATAVASSVWVFQDACNIGTQTFTFSRRTLNINGQTVTCGAFNIDGGSAGIILTLGAATINCTSWSMTSTTTSLTANTATINITGTGACALGSANWNGVDFNLNGTAHKVSGAATGIDVFTRNGTATNANSITFTSGTTLTVTTFAMIGNSRANQLLVQSSTLGTAATITATNWTGTLNADLMDITTTNAVDFSAGGLNNATIGNAGGNTGFTFIAAAPQTYTDSGDHKASTAGNWTSRIPLVGIDDTTIGATITYDMPRMGKSISVTAGTLTKSQNMEIYGSLTLTSGVIWAGNFAEIFRGRSSYTLNSAGISLYSFRPYNPSGLITLTAPLTSVTAIYPEGSFNDGGYTVITTAITRQLSLTGTITKSGIWALNTTSAGNKWNMFSTTGLTFVDTGTTILTNSGVNAQTFAGGGLTYNNVTIQGAGNYALTITGSNTFKTFTVDRSQANKTVIATGTTQTVGAFICAVSGVRTLTLTGGTWTKVGGGAIWLDFATITNVTGNPDATWYAGVNSTDGTGNTRVYFASPNPLQMVENLMPPIPNLPAQVFLGV